MNSSGFAFEYRIRTPEGVAFSFALASPVLRMGALVIDLLAISVASTTVTSLLTPLKVISADIAGLVITVITFLIAMGYGIGCEWRWRGQTVGKRLLRLRVLDERGWKLTFAQAAIRNLLRLVDMLPALYLVGGIAALMTQRNQRLGDLAAGTVVIWEPAEAMPDTAALRGDKYNSLRSHGPAVARLRQSVGPLEARAAWQAVVRRDQLEPEARIQLFADLASHFRRLAPIPQEATEGVSDEQFVRNVVDVVYSRK